MSLVAVCCILCEVSAPIFAPFYSLSVFLLLTLGVRYMFQMEVFRPIGVL